MKNKYYLVFLLIVVVITAGCSLFPNAADNSEDIPDAFKNPDNRYIMQTDVSSKALTQTYFAGGLVGDEFQILCVSSSGIFMGQVENSVSSTKGYSFIPLDKVDSI